MPLSFLAPLFLAGLAALAVPLIVHLVQREKREPIAFPSLMFMERIPYRSSRRQRIRHWLLLALRSLAVLLLAAAFARPFLDRRGAALAGTERRAREVVILLDRSYSMRYGDRWNRAVSAARAEASALAPDDRATLVTFDATARAVTEPSGDAAALGAAIGAVRPGDGATRYEPALKLAARLLDGSTRPRREVVLVSDFQRGGWQGGEDVRFPGGATLRPVDVSRGERADVAVTGVELRRTREGERESARLVARVANRGDAPVSRVVHLDVGGREVQRADVRLEPGATASVELASVAIPPDGARATVRLDPDAMPSDDVFHLALTRARDLPVLIVGPSGSASSAALYLTRALALGASPSFRVSSRSVDAFTAADLDARPLVILNGAMPPRGEAGRRLEAFVRDGGGLVIALGREASARVAGTLLPEIATPIDRVGEMGGVLGYVERAHPVFELFRQPRSGDFAEARFFRYARLRPAAGDHELARFDDGTPALIERAVGAGRVLVWASTLDGSWNDLPLQPIFLPFVHQLARYAAAWTERPAWHTVGEAAEPVEIASPDVRGASSGPALVATTPSGRLVRLASPDTARGRTLALDEQGFYELRPAGSTSGSPVLIAANVDLREADLAHVEPAEIVRAVSATSGGRRAAPDEVQSAAERERRQSIWWYLLAALLVLLATETVMSNAVTTRAAGRVRAAAD